MSVAQLLVEGKDDTNLQSRWQAICTRLQQAGYVNFSETPDHTGAIIVQPGKPKVGVWIMPDNQASQK